MTHVAEATHLTAEGALDPDAIVRTLARLFQHRMAHSSGTNVEAFLLAHLVRCYRNTQLRLTGMHLLIEVFCVHV